LHAYALDGTPVSANLLLRMAKDAGLRAQSTRIDWSALFRLGEAYPALVPLTNGNWILVLAAGQGPDGVESVRIFDPLAERQDEPLIVDRDLFCSRWSGEAILIKREQASSDGQRVFGLRWFLPELLRQWRLFADVAIAAILLYALGLALPIFFQLVIDKVLVHESFTTLYVLAAGATAALAFDAIFNFLRKYLLLYATNKVDIRVATKTFGHLLGLPVTFFEHISAGVLVKHMQQAARIRELGQMGAQRIRRDAEMTARSIADNGRRTVQAHLAATAARLARTLITDNFEAADQSRLLREFLDTVSQEARP